MVKIVNLIQNVVGSTILVEATLKEDGSVVDISGATGSLVVKDSNDSTFTTASGSLVSDGSDGKMEWEITDEVTATASATEDYTYVASITLSTGRVYYVLKGNLDFISQH